MCAVAIAVCMAIVGASLMSGPLAQSGQIDLDTSEAMRRTIEQQVGKRVKLKLVSGQDLDGQVARVGSQAVFLTELTGMEFYDATVKLDQVAAVIVRRATK